MPMSAVAGRSLCLETVRRIYEPVDESTLRCGVGVLGPRWCLPTQLLFCTFSGGKAVGAWSLTTHLHVVTRLKKEYSNTFPLCPHGLLKGERYLTGTCTVTVMLLSAVWLQLEAPTSKLGWCP
jgi:hypothetical protein